MHGKVDLEKAFAESCNAAFCSIGDGLEPEFVAQVM